MKFQTLLISVCLIYQVFAGGPSDKPSPNATTIPPSSLPLCVNCEDVWTKLVAPTDTICDIGDKHLCTVSGTIIQTNEGFSGYCAGSSHLLDSIDTAILSDVEVTCVA